MGEAPITNKGPEEKTPSKEDIQAAIAAAQSYTDMKIMNLQSMAQMLQQRVANLEDQLRRVSASVRTS